MWEETGPNTIRTYESHDYADWKPDLADLCLIRLSELKPWHRVITTDREDFRVYRRNQREVIPLICPPES